MPAFGLDDRKSELIVDYLDDLALTSTLRNHQRFHHVHCRTNSQARSHWHAPRESRCRAGLGVLLHDWTTTVDHKKLGILYVLMSIVFLVIGGLEAILMRWQLFFPRNDVIGHDAFNQLFTMHGTTMVFFVGMPILIGMGNYLVPLMIGAGDMAFPAAERLWLLGDAVRRPDGLSEFDHRRCARVGLVRLRAADGRTRFLPARRRISGRWG